MPSQIELIKKYGLQVRGHVGQHLLIDPNIQRKIVDVLAVRDGDPVFEIGPGLGALTGRLLEAGARVIAVEKDPRFVEVLRQEYADHAGGRLELVEADILDYDLSVLQKFLEKGRTMKAVSNLPYYITAPIIFKLMEARRLFSEAVLMMQKEVGARLVASPGTKDYGRLTLAVRQRAEAATEFFIPPSCFTPRPEVESAVVRLRFHTAEEKVPGLDDDFLEALIKTAFSQRRKTLIHLLVHDPGMNLNRPEAEKIFNGQGLNLKVRGEELLLKDFIRLALALQKRTS